MATQKRVLSVTSLRTQNIQQLQHEKRLHEVSIIVLRIILHVRKYFAENQL